MRRESPPGCDTCVCFTHLQRRYGKVLQPLKAEPTPAPPTQAKLIPIVTTAPTCTDGVELATTYTRRWAAQENIIRDFLLPLELDTNHVLAANGTRVIVHY